ncbi:DUF433 domain-containing protein [Nostoc sp. KVJ3]|uniref:DUF433 domain-containing protein n=1 Tax=Nostoc sp. KVJ3 TaxID=457945 RepID=UPI002237416D|nr:hypothetical protein [Nostoc sp. KVJ3]MCW5316569.1 DUF433 domain-containing protein [Nostoc sp. KVJ3]
MSKISVISEHIEITPGVCGGKPRIARHRIRIFIQIQKSDRTLRNQKGNRLICMVENGKRSGYTSVS